MEPPAVQQATGDSPLEAFVSSASTIALYAALEGSSRRALTRTSVKCRAWVFELAEQTTITLRAHGGLQEDAWSKRVSHAEAVLSQRAIFKHSTDKLRVSLPTPNPDALQSILSLTDPARHAVAHLEITQSASREYAEEGLHTPTLQLLPQAFPALRSLRINRLFGCLPPTELLAGLKELHVQIRARPDQITLPGQDTHTAVCLSVAAYTTQVHTLSIDSPSTPVPWSKVLGIASATLKRFKTSSVLTDELLTCVRKAAPSLEHLACQAPGAAAAALSPDHAKATWAVTELALAPQYTDGSSDAAVLAALPQSPAESGLRLLPTASDGLCALRFEVLSEQGLSEAVTTRMTTWHFPTSCRAILTGRKSATLPTPSYHTGIEAALPQLRVLPPQSTIKMFTDTFWGTTLRMMSTAQPSLPHITLLPWCMKGTEAATMSALCSVQQPMLHARVRVLSVATDEYATRAWPWKTFHIGGLTSGGLQSLLRLPDPGQAEGGMCEVGIGFLHLTPMTYEKWTFEQTTELHHRLQHMTCVIRDRAMITLKCLPSLQPTVQPAALRGLLQLLARFRVRHETRVAATHPTLSLDGWCLTPALLAELSALPRFDFKINLTFEGCDWQPGRTCGADNGALYAQLPHIVPMCYTTWTICRLFHPTVSIPTAETLMSICAGATERGKGVGGAGDVSAEGRQLTLCVHYGNKWSLGDGERSEVEACVDERGLRELVRLVWCYEPEMPRVASHLRNP